MSAMINTAFQESKVIQIPKANSQITLKSPVTINARLQKSTSNVHSLSIHFTPNNHSEFFDNVWHPQTFVAIQFISKPQFQVLIPSQLQTATRMLLSIRQPNQTRII
jgi:hypothetical protein